MKFPKMRPKQASELKIPDLSGGLNLRDGLSEVLDNQLTDCKNMWWQDGVLKTRPGMKTTEEINRYIGRPTTQTINIRNFPEIKYVESGKTYYLQVVQRAYVIEPDGDYTISLEFAWQNDIKAIPLSAIFINNDSEQINYFVCCKKNILYCFIGNRTIHTLDITKIDNQWKLVVEEEIYAPIVSYGGTFQSDLIPNGVNLESYNLLTPYYRMVYSTVNKSIVAGENKWHLMQYSLLSGFDKDDMFSKWVITAKLTNKQGVTHTHIATKAGELAEVFLEQEWDEETGGFKRIFQDNLSMRVSGRFVFFDTINTDTGEIEIAKVYEKDYVENNLEIKAPDFNRLYNDENYNKIFGMTQCKWFGGSSAGIADGTRLFLSGNINEDEKALVCWSSLNKPLYFPENSYFFVGDTTSAVTGFGKQSDMLVIFKENETWYTKYQQNTDITAKDVINQSVIDYEASSVYFPLVQINSSIGCKYPDTIQLCRNRLVWLGDNGNVYTLVSESQYNERSIFCVSEMVKNRLKKDFNIFKPTACDWNGYYCLCLGLEMYLMDYNCYGYTHIASYSKTEDANIRIPWYYWVLPVAGAICSLNDKMIYSYYHDGGAATQCYIVNNILSVDNKSVDTICYEKLDEEKLLFFEQSIESSITTKLFDFGEPNLRKNVDRINLQLGNNDGQPINVKIITECGGEEQELVLTGTETQSYTPGYIESKAIFPCIRQTVKIGLELSSKGVLAIDGMNIKYRTTGGAR